MLETPDTAYFFFREYGDAIEDIEPENREVARREAQTVIYDIEWEMREVEVKISELMDEKNRLEELEEWFQDARDDLQDLIEEEEEGE